MLARTAAEGIRAGAARALAARRWAEAAVAESLAPARALETLEAGQRRAAEMQARRRVEVPARRGAPAPAATPVLVRRAVGCGAGLVAQGPWASSVLAGSLPTAASTVLIRPRKTSSALMDHPATSAAASHRAVDAWPRGLGGLASDTRQRKNTIPASGRMIHLRPAAWSVRPSMASTRSVARDEPGRTAGSRHIALPALMGVDGLAGSDALTDTPMVLRYARADPTTVNARATVVYRPFEPLALAQRGRPASASQRIGPDSPSADSATASARSARAAARSVSRYAHRTPRACALRSATSRRGRVHRRCVHFSHANLTALGPASSNDRFARPTAPPFSQFDFPSRRHNWPVTAPTRRSTPPARRHRPTTRRNRARRRPPVEGWRRLVPTGPVRALG